MSQSGGLRRYVPYEESEDASERVRRPGAEAADPNGLSVFGAHQENLGLKLESRKSPVDILVVDNGVKVPTGN
jgi:uncharacterized protein (TIGR03435 family)